MVPSVEPHGVTHQKWLTLGKFLLHTIHCVFIWFGIAQAVQRLPTGSTIRVSNPGGGEIFRIRQNWIWGPSNLLENGNRISLPRANYSWRVVDPLQIVASMLNNEYIYIYKFLLHLWAFLACPKRSFMYTVFLLRLHLLDDLCDQFGQRRYEWENSTQSNWAALYGD